MLLIEVHATSRSSTQAGLFSAVSSAFVIDIQSELEPDPGEQFAAYLRAILFTLNQSAISGEDPTIPPAWSGPSGEIVAASNLLYASLLISLLAAFVAMLGKQWLNRYLRHAGGSVIERSRDRQRKHEKWLFHAFIESLPIMLQIALLLLSCGLSRQVWALNSLVACVVISLTALGVAFYIGIVIAGMSSYECPFQTPASSALRGLRDSTGLSVSPSRAIILTLLGRRYCGDKISAGFLRLYRAPRNPPLRNISLSSITSGMRVMGRYIGHQIILGLLHLDQVSRDTKRTIVSEVQRYQGRLFLPIAVATHRQFPTPQADIKHIPRNFIARALNADDASCVYLILKSITDPDAMDSAVRLACTVRWFGERISVDPPYDSIVSIFESCFDSTRNLRLGMKERAYFSGRAMLRLRMVLGDL